MNYPSVICVFTQEACDEHTRYCKGPAIASVDIPLKLSSYHLIPLCPHPEPDNKSVGAAPCRHWARVTLSVLCFLSSCHQAIIVGLCNTRL